MQYEFVKEPSVVPRTFGAPLSNCNHTKLFL
jgi:hypothetical protein